MFCATRIGRTLNKLRPSLLSTPELLKVPPAAISVGPAHMDDDGSRTLFRTGLLIGLEQIIGNHRSTISSLRSIPSHSGQILTYPRAKMTTRSRSTVLMLQHECPRHGPTG